MSRPVKILTGEEISNRCFPIKEEMKNYIDFIKDVKDKDEDLYKVLTLISCTGVRFTEALNSFILYDNKKDKYYLKCIALKRKQATNGFVYSKQKAMSTEEIRDLAIKNPNAFKIIPLINLFDLPVYDIYKTANDIDTPIRSLRPFFTYLRKKTYVAYFLSLKKFDIPFRVYYLESKLAGIEKEISIMPSFHFYRKLFVSELYEKTKDMPFAVEYMKWSQPNRIFDYVKAYQKNLYEQELGSNKLF